MPRSFPKLNILVAYNYLDSTTLSVIKNNQEQIRFLLDSGAFTSWKMGKKVNLDEYIAFIKSMEPQPWRYFMLDVIGNPQETKQNLDMMLGQNLKPIPIFTRGENIEELERMYSVSDHVAIGGLVGTIKNTGFVKNIMEKIGNRKVHWLGFTQPNFISAYRPYSCDSSSWSGAVRYGGLKIYTRGGRFITVKRLDFLSKPNIELVKIFEEYGEDISLFKNKKEWTNSGKGNRLLERMTYKSWVRMMIDCEKNLGTYFFLACSCKWQVELMVWAYNYWRNKYENSHDFERRNGLGNAPVLAS